MTGKLTRGTVNNQNGSTLYQVHVFGELPNGATAFGLWCPPGNAEQEEIAKRLVACWNLCDGVPTEQVEAAPYLERLIVERGRLLAALKMVLAVIVSEFDCGSEQARVKRYQAQVDAARAVIAKVEGA